jgi:hypothetical protein
MVANPPGHAGRNRLAPTQLPVYPHDLHPSADADPVVSGQNRTTDRTASS